MATFEEKCRVLSGRLAALTEHGAAVAFSGGADSSLLLKLAVMSAQQNGTKVWGITAATRLHPAADTRAAQQTAREIGAEHIILRLDELKQAGIEDNPPDRCYRCKKYLFGEIQKKAAALGAGTLLEGTNADDLNAYRPGLRALKELGVISPLMEAGFTKEEVRVLAREHGILAADRPAAPCLATRFPYGTRLTQEKLRQAERGEEFLKTCGFYNVRLRVHDALARIEVDEKEFPLACEKRREITERLRELGFDYVTLDLEGFRSGSMDIHIK